METGKSDIYSFFERIGRILENKRSKSNENERNKAHFRKDQDCYMIFDLSKNKVTDFFGWDRVFGYELDQFDLSFFDDKDHPDDIVQLRRVLSSTFKQLISTKVSEGVNVLNITYRFKHNNGNYVKVLCSVCVYETSKSNNAIKLIARYSDISFMGFSGTLEWDVNDSLFDRNEIIKSVHGESAYLFTDRELEVISCLFGGYSNRDIAEKLSISEHTVATHRKNILSKSGCNDINSLKSFCLSHGVSKLLIPINGHSWS